MPEPANPIPALLWHLSWPPTANTIQHSRSGHFLPSELSLSEHLEEMKLKTKPGWQLLIGSRYRGGEDDKSREL